jgi:hypothetical protein
MPIIERCTAVLGVARPRKTSPCRLAGSLSAVHEHILAATKKPKWKSRSTENDHDRGRILEVVLTMLGASGEATMTEAAVECSRFLGFLLR